jgi:zeaxanthin glucosyltransferase
MKIGFICLNLPGHLNPMTALARQLQGRNHEVVFLYSSSANGLPCVPGDDRDPMNENRAEVSKLQGDDALGFVFGLLVQRTEAMLKSMPLCSRRPPSMPSSSTRSNFMPNWRR